MTEHTSIEITSVSSPQTTEPQGAAVVAEGSGPVSAPAEKNTGLVRPKMPEGMSPDEHKKWLKQVWEPYLEQRLARDEKEGRPSPSDSDTFHSGESQGPGTRYTSLKQGQRAVTLPSDMLEKV